jgi:hypothetical protein
MSMQATRILSALALVLSSVASKPSTPAPVTEKRQQSLPSWFVGAWEREWVRRAGVTDDTVTVRFLQTPTMFGDLRIPSSRPRFPHAAALADLTERELATLAEQRGFFGYTTIEGNVATWHHEIDYQPPEAAADIGRLERVGGGGMYEHALDDSYMEYWWSLTSGDGRYLVVRVTRRDHDVQRLDRVLLVVGDHFAYAHNRAKDLPAARSLTDLIVNSHATIDTVRDYLDCELSHGYVRAATVPWEITNSTLPWREGSHLELADQIVVDSAGRLSALSAPGETWTFPINTMRVEDLRVLFPAKRE